MPTRGCTVQEPGWQSRHRVTNHDFSRTLLEGATEEGESPVGDGVVALLGYVSTAGHVESRGKLGGPPSKAKYLRRPIVNEYREGQVKSTPVRGVKEILKPCASRLSEPPLGGNGVPIGE
jgi:hypothetical protein